MNFTTEQLAEALKAKMTANGKKLAISDRTIKAQAERIYRRLDKAQDNSTLDAVVEEYLPDFEEIDANTRNTNSQFVKQWETEHAEKNKNNSNVEKTAPNNPDDKIDSLYKAIQEMKAEREAEKAQQQIRKTRGDIRNALSKKGIRDDKWLDAYMRKLHVNSDTNVEAETNEALDFYNLSHTPATNDTTPGNAGGSTQQFEVDFTDVVKMRKRQRGEDV